MVKTILKTFLSLSVLLAPSQAEHLDLSLYPDLPLDRPAVREKKEPGVEDKDQAGQKSRVWPDQVKAEQVEITAKTYQPPKPKPQPTAGDLETLFKTYGEKYGVEKSLLRKIASCESGFNSQAVNGPYGGMYQFTVYSWQSTRKAMAENPDPSLRFEAEEAIKTAAFKISRGGINAWPNCH